MPKVDFSDINDVDATIHASMGLFSRAVGDKLGLSAGQAQYRINKGGASPARKQWREGSSPLYHMLSANVLKENRHSEKERLMAAYAKERDKQVKEKAAKVKALAAQAKARRKTKKR